MFKTRKIVSSFKEINLGCWSCWYAVNKQIQYTRIFYCVLLLFTVYLFWKIEAKTFQNIWCKNNAVKEALSNKLGQNSQD